MQRLGQSSDFAQDQQGRRAYVLAAGALGQVGKRAEHDALPGARAVLDQRERRRRRAAVRQQAIAQRVQARDAHVDRQRLPLLGERAPVERVERILAVGSDQAQ